MSPFHTIFGIEDNEARNDIEMFGSLEELSSVVEQLLELHKSIDSQIILVASQVCKTLPQPSYHRNEVSKEYSSSFLGSRAVY